MNKYLMRMKLPVCKPIKSLMAFSETEGFEVVEKKMSDYHFHELYIKMAGETLVPGDIRIEGISKAETRNSYFCSCHWSCVEIVESASLV